MTALLHGINSVNPDIPNFCKNTSLTLLLDLSNKFIGAGSILPFCVSGAIVSVKALSER